MRWISGETLEQKIKRVLGENFVFHEDRIEYEYRYEKKKKEPKKKVEQKDLEEYSAFQLLEDLCDLDVNKIERKKELRKKENE